MVEWWSDGMVEWWNIGVMGVEGRCPQRPKWRNGGVDVENPSGGKESNLRFQLINNFHKAFSVFNIIAVLKVSF